MLRRIVGRPHFCATCSAHLDNKRHASRPTFSEVSDALSILGADLNTDAKELKKKYRELVRKHHPDAGGNEAMMSKVTVAYDRLSSLSNREREEFKQQRNAYRGGSGHTAAASRAYAGFARQQAPNASQGFNTSAHSWQQGPDFTRAHAAGNAKATYNYNRGSAYSQNPFQGNPFDMRRYTQSVARMPFGNFVIRAIAVYAGLSIVTFIFYRRYSDWRHDDGWKASDSLARHEQMEHLHRLRQELNEKISAAREGRNPNKVQDFERSRELRVMEYSQRHVVEQQEMEYRCWPKFDDSKGSLVKKRNDPPGITYFEPGADNDRRRQLVSTYGESRAERAAREEAVSRAERRKVMSDTNQFVSDPTRQNDTRGNEHQEELKLQIQSILGSSPQRQSA